MANMTFASPTFVSRAWATLSNCGNTLRAFTTKHFLVRENVARANDLGYGKNVKDTRQWAIRSQVPYKQKGMQFTEQMSVGLAVRAKA